jgi:hypothetical protein
MKTYITTLTTGLLLLHTLPANAADIPFNGTVVASCVLTVGTPGILAVNSDSTILGSQQSGGLAGSANALTTGTGYSVSVSSPASFTLGPADASDNVTFSSSYQGSGATNFSQTSESTSTSLNLGLTTIGVDLTATKTSGIFSAGNYTAATTVTCE